MLSQQVIWKYVGQHEQILDPRWTANVHRVSCDSLHAYSNITSPWHSRHNLRLIYHTKFSDTFRGFTLDHAPLPSTLQFPNRFFSSVLPLGIRFALMSAYLAFPHFLLELWIGTDLFCGPIVNDSIEDSNSLGQVVQCHPRELFEGKQVNMNKALTVGVNLRHIVAYYRFSFGE